MRRKEKVKKSMKKILEDEGTESKRKEGKSLSGKRKIIKGGNKESEI